MTSEPLLGEHFLVAAPFGENSGFPFPGSVVVLPGGTLLAVFTGLREGEPHRGVGCYSGDGGKTWSAPVVLFGGDAPGSDAGESYADPNIVIVNERRVLAFCVSLRYDENVWDLSRTRFWRRISEDGGETFGPVEELPRHKKYYVGTTHPGMRLRNGALVMGYSWDKPAEVGRPAEGEGTMDLVAGVLISRDEGMSWEPGGDCWADTSRAANALEHATNGLDEPAVVELPNGDLFMLARTGTNRLWQSFSRDGGLTWEAPEPSPLTSHNCPAALLRLADDSVLVVYNNHPTRRFNLSVAISTDDCRTWSAPRKIGPVGGSEEAEAAYPAVCQLADGALVAVFYQIDRGAKEPYLFINAVRFTV